jgi:hypothetical protein
MYESMISGSLLILSSKKERNSSTSKEAGVEEQRERCF